MTSKTKLDNYKIEKGCKIQFQVGYLLLLSFGLMIQCSIAQPTIVNGKSNSDMIVRAQQNYNAGKIEKAEHLALKIITDDNDLTKYEKYNAYRLLAFCSIAAGNVEAGKKHFISAIVNNPNMTADPLTWSPKLRIVFDSAVAEVSRQKKIEKEWIYASSAQLGRAASLKSLFLPGAGQLMKNQKQKGLTLGILTYLSMASYVYGQFYLPKVRDDYLAAGTPNQAEARWEEYRNARYTVSITGLIALGIYSYTFFDALWSDPNTKVVNLPNEELNP